MYYRQTLKGHYKEIGWGSVGNDPFLKLWDPATVALHSNLILEEFNSYSSSCSLK